MAPILCQLRTIRRHYDEATDAYALRVEACGQPLQLTEERGSMLQLDGEHYELDGAWRVECLLGHVLLIPDLEGNDGEIPFGPLALSELLIPLAGEREALAAVLDNAVCSPDWSDRSGWAAERYRLRALLSEPDPLAEGAGPG